MNRPVNETKTRRAQWRESIENLHTLARGHDYAEAKELAAGDEAIFEVFTTLDAVEADLRLLLEDLSKAEPTHFSIGLMGVRVKQILSRLAAEEESRV